MSAAVTFPWGGKARRSDTVVPANALVPYPVAQTLRRQYLWLRRCPQCQKARLYRADQRTCSQTCGKAFSHWRRPQQEKRLRAIQVLSAQAKVRARDARIARECAGLTAVEAYALAYRRGYAAGHLAGTTGARPLHVIASQEVA